jgi:hypothetical protein
MCKFCETSEATIKEIFNEMGITDMMTCMQAHEIIEKCEVSFGDIGAYCDKHNVKIRSCQLGCFK